MKAECRLRSDPTLIRTERNNDDTFVVQRTSQAAGTLSSILEPKQVRKYCDDLMQYYTTKAESKELSV